MIAEEGKRRMRMGFYIYEYVHFANRLYSQCMEKAILGVVGARVGEA